ncbi:hypothetical protein TREES_T100001446 [Tupaia chinensis]|uniref:Uncharacterized protein n=1 Tax=Tupaia chinensis TaxID=246437 RepID=L9L4X3_TUPCH|nr:hypothetical protein TREES_T100001446 [Tupaia chinensis]
MVQDVTPALPAGKQNRKLCPSSDQWARQLQGLYLEVLEMSNAEKRSIPENTFSESNTEVELFILNKNSEHVDLGFDSCFEYSGRGKSDRDLRDSPNCIGYGPGSQILVKLLPLPLLTPALPVHVLHKFFGFLQLADIETGLAIPFSLHPEVN